MSGATARAEIVRLARKDGRAARFLARRRGERTESFAELCAAPRWPVLDEKERIRVGAVALLLSGRSALAREIDGQRLRSYAALVGYPVLERMLAEGGEGRMPLPPAHALEEEARRFVVEGHAQSLNVAELFLREAQSWPST